MKFLKVGLFFVIVFSSLISQAVTWMDITPVIVKMKKNNVLGQTVFLWGKTVTVMGFVPTPKKKTVGAL